VTQEALRAMLPRRTRVLGAGDIVFTRLSSEHPKSVLAHVAQALVVR
jgi:hypothetical protein